MYISVNIYFNNVYFKYPDTDKLILSGFNLEIKKRQWIGIEGPSGIGKTTIFELLLKFYSPTSGSIFIDGQDIKVIERESLRQNITCMFQNPYIMDCTVRENILLANPNATEKEFNYAVDICKLKKLQQQQIIQLMNLVKKVDIFKLSFQHNYTQLNRIKEVLEKNVFK